MATPLKMPQLGESVVKGKIIRWLKAAGDMVQEYKPLVEVETDKVITEITANTAGVLLQILIPAGETAEVGAVLAYVGQVDEFVPDGTASPVAPIGPTETSAELPQPRRFTPMVMRLVQEHNLSPEELNSMAGTGRDGRVSKRDVLRYLETRSQPAPSDPQPVEQGQTIELTPMRAAIAAHMLRSVQTSPHVTTIFEVDVSRVVAYRQTHRAEFARQGINLAYTAFFVQAVVEALKVYPLANASLADGKIVLHPHLNVGVAVAVEGGLLVPVIKQAEDLSLRGLARAIDDLAERARTKKRHWVRTMGR